MEEEFVRTQRIGYGENRGIWTSEHRSSEEQNQIYVHRGGAEAQGKTDRVIGTFPLGLIDSKCSGQAIL